MSEEKPLQESTLFDKPGFCLGIYDDRLGKMSLDQLLPMD